MPLNPAPSCHGSVFNNLFLRACTKQGGGICLVLLSTFPGLYSSEQESAPLLLPSYVRQQYLTPHMLKYG